MKLSDVPGTQPDGFLVRFPFYVIAERDAHIVFSQSQNPDWFVDDVYEFGKYCIFFFYHLYYLDFFIYFSGFSHLLLLLNDSILIG